MAWIWMDQLPNVLELVGLGYTIWFSSRYLIFKVSILKMIITSSIWNLSVCFTGQRLKPILTCLQKNRDELVAKVEQIKQQVLGSKGE